MRMARLRVKKGIKYELITSPANIQLLVSPKSILVNTIGDVDDYKLNMPLDEAIEELNAAMNYNRYEEAALQGSKLRERYLDGLVSIQEVKLSTQEYCTCGGAGPGEGCPACDIYADICIPKPPGREEGK